MTLPAPKIIYLAKRRGDMTRAQFIERWRRHGALAMAQPRWVNVERYSHLDTLPELAGPSLSTAYDGVGMLWFRSAQHYAARNQDNGSRSLMEADELGTFDQPVAMTRQVFEEQIVVPMPATSSLRLLCFAWRGDGDANGNSAAAYRANQHARWDTLDGTATGHTVNAPIGANADGTVLDCDAVEEWGFRDLTSLRQGLRVLASFDLGTAVSRKTLTLAMREVVLHDLRSGIPSPQ